MFGYYLQLAWLNIRRSPWLSALVVLVVGVGIGASMSLNTMMHVLSRDPLPEHSGRLYTPRFESNTFAGNYRGPEMVPTFAQMAWRDAMALWQAQRAQRQAVMFSTSYVVTTGADRPVVGVRGLATHADLFPMFGLKILEGNYWSAAEGAGKARVVVLASSFAKRLFPDEKGVGRSLLLDGHSYLVKGVVEDWAPQPRFHMPTSPLLFGTPSNVMEIGFGPGDELYIPLETAVAHPGPPVPTGALLCMGAESFASREQLLDSDCPFTSLWVELDDPDAARRYEEFLGQYLARQVSIGRFDSPRVVRLYSLQDWVSAVNVPRILYRFTAALGFLLLLACLCSAVSLLLSRSEARSTELALHRALGAPRRELFLQCLTESLVLGSAGTVLGIVLLHVGIAFQRMLLPSELAQLADVDMSILAFTIALSLAGTVGAGVYPAWAAARASSLGHRYRPARSRLGAVLVAVQVALTQFVVAWGAGSAWYAIPYLRGGQVFFDVGNVFAMQTTIPGPLETQSAQVDRDMAVLRAIPSVHSATPSTSIFNGMDKYFLIEEAPGSGGASVTLPFYARVLRADHYALDTFGLRMMEGDWFRPGQPRAPEAVVTREVGRVLFRERSALDKFIRVDEKHSYKVIGIIDNTPGVLDGDKAVFVSADYMPAGAIAGHGTVVYVVRAWPGQLQTAMREAAARLKDPEHARVLSLPKPLAESSAELMRPMRAVVASGAGLSLLLIAVVLLGVAGITYTWVQRRRFEIGIRRALGARRTDVLRHLQIENAGIVGWGIVAGTLLLCGANMGLAVRLFAPEVRVVSMLGSAAVIVLFTQLAVLWPAHGASRIPPAIAARNG